MKLSSVLQPSYDRLEEILQMHPVSVINNIRALLQAHLVLGFFHILCNVEKVDTAMPINLCYPTCFIYHILYFTDWVCIIFNSKYINSMIIQSRSNAYSKPHPISFAYIRH